MWATGLEDWPLWPESRSWRLAAQPWLAENQNQFGPRPDEGPSLSGAQAANHGRDSQLLAFARTTNWLGSNGPGFGLPVLDPAGPQNPVPIGDSPWLTFLPGGRPRKGVGLEKAGGTLAEAAPRRDVGPRLGMRE
jgi:hypothetical protein